MKKLTLLLALVACGDSTVRVGGEVIVKHQVDLLMFEEYYKLYCESIHYYQDDIDACVEDKMAELVDSLTQNGLM